MPLILATPFDVEVESLDVAVEALDIEVEALDIEVETLVNSAQRSYPMHQSCRGYYGV